MNFRQGCFCGRTEFDQTNGVGVPETPSPNGVITISCTRSRGPRGFSCLQDFRRGPVNVDVIIAKQKQSNRSMASKTPTHREDSEQRSLPMYATLTTVVAVSLSYWFYRELGGDRFFAPMLCLHLLFFGAAHWWFRRARTDDV